MKNENRVDEMIDILKELQGYIPCVKKSVEVSIPGLDVVETVNADVLHSVLFGGDQLTRVRASSAQIASSNHQSREGRLEGFQPVREAWHCKVCFLGVWPCILTYMHSVTTCKVLLRRTHRRSGLLSFIYYQKKLNF